MQKFVNLVDLVKGFPTTIYLQRFVSIQPRTSLSKFAKNWQKVRKKVRTFIGCGQMDQAAPPMVPKFADPSTVTPTRTVSDKWTQEMVGLTEKP